MRLLPIVLLALRATASFSCQFINLASQNVFSSSGASISTTVDALVDLSSNVWDSDSGFPGPKFVVFDLVAQRKLDCLRLKPASSNSSPTRFILSVSPDGINFANIQTFTNNHAFTETTTYTISKPSFGRYWRLEFEDAFGAFPVQLEFVQFSADSEFRVLEGESLRSYSLETSAQSWIAARSQCELMGSTLAQVNGPATQLAFGAVVAQGGVGKAWVRRNDGDHWQGHEEAQDCVVMGMVDGVPKAFPSDEPCTTANAFVCETSELSSLQTSEPCGLGYTLFNGKCTRQPFTSARQKQSTCPSGFSSVRDSSNTERCYQFFASPKTWFLAREACQALGANLARIYDTTTLAFLQTLIQATDTWVGLTRVADQVNWLWQGTGGVTESTTAFFWASGEPNGALEPCGNLAGAGVGVRDFVCESTNNYLCEFVSSGANPCDSGFRHVEGFCMRVATTSTALTYSGRTKACAVFGAELPCMDATTQRIISTEIMTQNIMLRVGEDSSNAILPSGCPAFSQYSVGQPDRADETCVEALIPPSTNKPGLWNDITCLSTNAFVCSYVAAQNRCPTGWAPFAGDCFLVTPNAQSFSAARTFCASLFPTADVACVKNTAEKEYLQGYHAFDEIMYVGLQGTSASNIKSVGTTCGVNVPFTGQLAIENAGHQCVKTEVARFVSVDCSTSIKAICRLPLNPSPSQTPTQTPSNSITPTNTPSSSTSKSRSSSSSVSRSQTVSASVSNSKSSSQTTSRSTSQTISSSLTTSRSTTNTHSTSQTISSSLSTSSTTSKSSSNTRSTSQTISSTSTASVSASATSSHTVGVSPSSTETPSNTPSPSPLGNVLTTIKFEGLNLLDRIVDLTNAVVEAVSAVLQSAGFSITPENVLVLAAVEANQTQAKSISAPYKNLLQLKLLSSNLTECSSDVSSVAVTLFVDGTTEISEELSRTLTTIQQQVAFSASVTNSMNCSSTFECCANVTNSTFLLAPMLIGEATEPAPNSVPTGITQSIDTNPEQDLISLRISFVRCANEGAPGQDLVYGYRLEGFNPTVANSTVVFAVHRLDEIGGASGLRVRNPFRFLNLKLFDPLTQIRLTHFRLLATNLIGDSPSSVEFEIRDFSRPTTLATDVAQSPDIHSRLGILTATIAFKRPADEIQGPFGTSGYRLYSASNGVRVELVASLNLTQLGGAPGVLVDRGFQVANFRVDPGVDGWIVTAFNEAFESLLDAAGALSDQGITRVLSTAVSTVAVVGASAAVASSASTGVLSGGSMSISSGGGASSYSSARVTRTGPNPMISAGMMQSMNMTGQLQLKTIPASSRGAGSAMSITNFDFKLLGSAQSKRGIGNRTLGDDENVTGVKMLRDAVEEVNNQVNIITDGRPPDQWFRETLLGVSIVLLIVIALIGAQIYYHRSVPKHLRTPALQATTWKYTGLSLSFWAFAYYGTMVVSLFILSIRTNGLNTALAVIICLSLGLSLPLLATYQVYKLRQISRAIEAPHLYKDHEMEQLQHHHKRTMAMYDGLIGGVEPGCEWYSAAQMYRKLGMAGATALMANYEYSQTWVVTAIYLANFICCVLGCPYEGGYKSPDFFVDASGQFLTLLGCFIPLYYFHTTGEPNETAGTICMGLQMASILIMMAFTLPDLFESVNSMRKKRKERKSNPKEQPQPVQRSSSKDSQSADLELPASFISAVFKSRRFTAQELPRTSSYRPIAIMGDTNGARPLSEECKTTTLVESISLDIEKSPHSDSDK